MARFYAQLCTAVFLLVTVGGLLLGNAVSISGGTGSAGGNLAGITLHLTWGRDVLDALFLVIFAYVGFFADRRAGRMLTVAAGLVLFGLGVVGFLIGDNDQANIGVSGLNFPVVVNVFDLGVGVLAILAALGTITDPGPAETESIIRPGTAIGSKAPVTAAKSKRDTA